VHAVGKGTALVLAATLAGSAPLRAQVVHPAAPDTARDAAHRVELFDLGFTRNVALAVAGSLVLIPLDEHVRAWARDPARQDNSFLHDGVHAVMPMGSTVPIVAAVGLYGVGRIAHAPVMTDIGLHVTEAIGGAGVVSLALKALVGRARPFVPPHDPHRFGKQSLRRPFDNGYESFPSGHATVAFATASAATDEIAAHWPGKQWVFGPLLYAVAASVAFGRVYLDKHWTSDVVAGAAIGGLVGDRVVRAVHSGGGGLLTKLNPVLVFEPGRTPMVGLGYAFR
jgi:membrane-associated phospholipid phosphatase